MLFNSAAICYNRNILHSQIIMLIDLEKLQNTDNSQNKIEKPDLVNQFSNLQYTSDLKDINNISQVTEWFKKEIDR